MARQAILNTLTPDERAQYIDSLRLTKARMTALLLYFRPLYDKCGIEFRDAPSLTSCLNAWMNGDYSLKSETLRDVFVNLFYGDGNVKQAAGAWAPAMRAAILSALDTNYISLTFLTGLVRENSPAWEDQNGNTVSLSLDKLRGLFSTEASNSSSYLTIDNSIRPAVASAFRKNEPLVVKVYDRPDDSALEIFNCEAESVARGAELLRVMNEHGIFPRQSAVPFAEKDVKLVASMVNLKELFTSRPPRQLAMFRTRAMMFILSMASSLMPRKNTPPYSELLRQYFSDSSFWAVYTQFVNVAMPYFNRLIMATTEGMSMQYIGKIYQQLRQFSKTNTDSRWIDIGSLTDFIISSSPEKAKYGLATTNLYFATPENALSHTRVVFSNLLAQFTRPLIYGSLMVLVSLGMAEVAYRPSEPDRDMPFGIFRFIRLTDLGRYVFGMESHYASPALPRAALPTAVLDPDNLIIRTESVAAAATIKKLMGVKVTNNRYVVTEASVLRDVRTVSDLHNKIDSLKAIVKCDLPPLWTDFFDRVAKRIGTIKAYPLRDYALYQIEGDDSGVARVIMENKDIRRLIRLVEGGAFMVRYQDINELSQLIAAQGYKLPAPVSTYCYF